MSNISTAIAISNATKEAVYSDDVVDEARDFMNALVGEATQHQIKLLFKYSAALASATASRVTEVLMTESDFDKMLEEVNEFEEMGKSINGE